MGDASFAIGAVGERLEQHRRELTAYCYRMLGSAFEAEDAVQETFIRAWRALRPVRGPFLAALVALPDRDERVLRHAGRPPAPGAADGHRAGARRRRADSAHAPGGTWIEPVPDGRVVPERRSRPRSRSRARSIRLAFVAALQHLPPRQRAVLILREVLRWQASEVAELLETTVASVNSALQRARATLADGDLDAADGAATPLDDDAAGAARALRRRVRALRHRRAHRAAPRGRDAVDAAVRALAPGPRRHLALVVRARASAAGARGCVPTVAANGSPAFGQYKPSARAAATSRGRSRCSSSRTAGSPSSRSSSTPRRSSRCSGSRRGSTKPSQRISRGPTTRSARRASA